MMTLQRYDAEVTSEEGESIRRITALATIFLPLSLATVSFAPNYALLDVLAILRGCIVAHIRSILRDCSA